MGLRQYQIVNDQITRNLISLVENNKIPLTSNAAGIIIECVNAIAEEKGSSIRITERDLRVEGIYEARLKIASYLETFENVENEGRATIEFMIHDINVLFSQHDLPEQKANLYHIIGNYFEERGDYGSAILYFLKCYEATVRISDIDGTLDIISILVKNYLKNLEYTNAVRFAKIAENIVPINSTVKFQAILFNKALAYKNNKEYKRCIWEIDRIVKTWPLLTPSKVFDLKLLKANCLLELEHYSEALDIYHELYQSVEKPKEQAMILANVLTTHRKLEDSASIREPIRKLKELIEILGSSVNLVSQLKMDLAEALIFIGSLEEAKKVLFSALDFAVNEHDYESIRKIITLMMATGLDEVTSPQEVFDTLKNTVEQNKLKQDNDFILKTVRYFNQKRTPELLDQILKYLEENEA